MYLMAQRRLTSCSELGRARAEYISGDSANKDLKEKSSWDRFMRNQKELNYKSLPKQKGHFLEKAKVLYTVVWLFRQSGFPTVNTTTVNLNGVHIVLQHWQ